MEVTIAKEVLTVVGLAELTAANSNLFRKKICAALNGHTVVEIDLSQTTIMDCAGLGALIAVRNLIRGRKRVVVRLVNPTSPVQQVLDLVRVGQIFEIVNTGPTDLPGSRATAFPPSILSTSSLASPSPTTSGSRSRLIEGDRSGRKVSA